MTYKRVFLLLPLVVFSSVFATSPAAAACTVFGQGVSFSSYNSLAQTANDGVGSVMVSCTVTTTVTVSLSTGAGTYTSRRLTAGSDQLKYNLFINSARTTVWGDGISASNVTASVRSQGATFFVYGRIPAQQKLPAKSYADTVVATISY